LRPKPAKGWQRRDRAAPFAGEPLRASRGIVGRAGEATAALQPVDAAKAAIVEHDNIPAGPDIVLYKG
jgi:hypothetical protein